MPRTKQTRPRHIIESGKTSEGTSVPVQEECDSFSDANFVTDETDKTSETPSLADWNKDTDLSQLMTIDTNDDSDAKCNSRAKNFAENENIYSQTHTKTTTSEMSSYHYYEDEIREVKSDHESSIFSHEKQDKNHSRSNYVNSSSTTDHTSSCMTPNGGNAFIDQSNKYNYDDYKHNLYSQQHVTGLLPSSNNEQLLNPKHSINMHSMNLKNQGNWFYPQTETNSETNSSSVNDFMSSTESFRQDPAHYQILTAAASQYFNALKTLIENNKTDSDNRDLWKVWANSARATTEKDAEIANNSSLYNHYVAQLTERWKVILQQQFLKPPECISYSPNRVIDEVKNEQPDTASQVQVDKEKEVRHAGSNECILPNTGVITPPLSDHAPSRKASDAVPITNDLSFETPVNDTHKPTSPAIPKIVISPIDQPSPSVEPKATENSLFETQSSSPIDMSKHINLPSHNQNVPYSESSVKNDRSSQINYNPYTFRPWMPSEWLGYPLFKVPLSDRYLYSHFPENYASRSFLPDPNNKTSSALLSDKDKSDAIRKLSLPDNRLISDIQFPNKASNAGFCFDSNSILPSTTLPRRKFSESSAFFKKPEYSNNRFLEEVRRQYSLSHPSLGSAWLGGSLSPNSIPSLQHPNMHSPHNVNNSSAQQLFFPSPMAAFTPGYPQDMSLSSREGPTYSPNVTYKPESIVPVSLSSAVGKANSTRRSRSRTNPIDSVHAAIVREAKEQFKGLDPENMYIQCPICQKRIKRLYHFQRHMRIHTGEKTHQCPCCQYKSVRKDNLKSHMKTHEKQAIENGRKAAKSTYRNSETSVANKTNNHLIIEHPKISFSSHQVSDSSKSTSYKANAKLIHSSTSANQDYSSKALLHKNASMPEEDRFLSSYSSALVSQISPKQRTDPNIFEGLATNNNHKNYKADVKFQFLPAQSTVLPNFLHSDDNNAEIKNGVNVLFPREKSSHLTETKTSSVLSNPEKIADRADRNQQTQKQNFADYSKSEGIIDTNERDKVIKRQKVTHCNSPSEKDDIVKSTHEKGMNANNNNDSSVEEKAEQNLFLSLISNENHATSSTSPLSSPSIFSDSAVQCSQGKDAEQRPQLNTCQDKFVGNRFTTKAPITPSCAVSDEFMKGNNNCEQKPVSPMTSSASGGSVFSSVGLQTFPNSSALLKASDSASPPAIAEKSSTDQSLNDPIAFYAQPFNFNLGQDVLNNVTNSKSPAAGFVSTSDVKPTFTTTVKTEFPSSFDAHLDSTKSFREKKKTSKQNNSNRSMPLQVSHPKEQGKILNDATAQPKGVVCRLCSLSFSSSVELQSHMSATHKQDGLYKCEECNYLGKNLSKLVEHIRIHTGERPFKCDQCNYAAKRKDNLAQHKAVRHDKRKAKSNSLYSAPDQKVSHDCSPEAIGKCAGSPNSYLSKRKSETSDKNPANNTIEKFSFFPNFQFTPKMNIFHNYIKEDEKLRNSSTSAPITTSFHGFSGISTMHGLAHSGFPYPFYQAPSVIHPSDIHSNLSGNPKKNVNNPATYSVKIELL